MKVKGAQLAKAAGILNSAITNNVKRENLIRGDDKLFDLDDPKNRDWCLRQGINPDTCEKQSTVKVEAEKKEKTKKKQELSPVTNLNSIDDDDFENLSGLPARMANMTLRQVVMRYGGPMQLKGYVDILDKIMSAQKKDVEMQERRKELVPRKFVEYLKSYVDQCNNRLFDYADGCAAEIISLSIADPEKAKLKIPELLRKNFTKIAEETQKRIDKEIKNLKVADETEGQK